MDRLFFLGFLSLFLSCDSGDDSSTNELSVLTRLIGDGDISYAESLSKWDELKSKNGNSYVYQTTFSSWAGFGNTTELRIENGEITQRIFQGYTRLTITREKEILPTFIRKLFPTLALIKKVPHC